MQNPLPLMPFETAAQRRRFYLERGLRRGSTGSGSDLAALMDQPREPLDLTPKLLFGDIRTIVVGGVAARAYAPERYTKDVDFLVDHEQFIEASNYLEKSGWIKRNQLLFPNASLGLYGQAWEKRNRLIDTIASPQPWAAEAIDRPARDQTGLPVIDLPYLVLMKLDSGRGIDQADLTRMLGRVDDERLEVIVAMVDRLSHDPAAAQDVRQYATLGRLEYHKRT